MPFGHFRVSSNMTQMGDGGVSIPPGPHFNARFVRI